MRRIASGVAVVAVGAGMALSATALSVAAGDRDRPRDIQVKNGDQKAPGSQGNFCSSKNGTTLCGDFVYPLKVRGSIEAVPGELIRLKMHDRAIGPLRAALLQADEDTAEFVSKVETRRVKANPQTWVARIPADVEEANRISISVRYMKGRGDSNWWAGIELVEPAPE